MARKFVLMTDSITKDQEFALRDGLKHMAWWHWLPNSWLLVDTGDAVTVDDVRDAFQKAAPNERCLALEVTSDSWSAMTRPNAKGRPMEGWLADTWDKYNSD